MNKYTNLTKTIQEEAEKLLNEQKVPSLEEIEKILDKADPTNLGSIELARQSITDPDTGEMDTSRFGRSQTFGKGKFPITKQEIEKLRLFAANIPDDADEELIQKVAEIIGALENVDADATFTSDSFSIERIKKNDPGLAQAIEVFQGKDINKSNLLFDGEKLHWRVGQEIVYSWNASSGHFEDDILGDPEVTLDIGADREAAKRLSARVIDAAFGSGKGDKTTKMRAIVKVLDFDSIKDNPNFTKNRFIEDVRALVDKVDSLSKVVKNYKRLIQFRGDASFGTTTDGGRLTAKDARRAASLEFKKDLRSTRDEYRKLNRQIRTLVMPYVEFKSGAEYSTSREDRREQMSAKQLGPTPEGKYLIKHRLQDLSNRTNADPFLDMLLPAVAVLEGDDALTAGTTFGKLAYREAEGLDPGRATGDAAWGRYRVRITNIVKDKQGKFRDPTKNFMNIKAYQGNRNGFFIHGGSFRGSSGCIDLGDEMDSFAKFWTVGGVAKTMGPNIKKTTKFDKLKVTRSNEQIKVIDDYIKWGGRVGGSFTIPLYVKYKEREIIKLKAKNPFVKKYSDFVFGKSGERMNRKMKFYKQLDYLKNPELQAMLAAEFGDDVPASRAKKFVGNDKKTIEYMLSQLPNR